MAMDDPNQDPTSTQTPSDPWTQDELNSAQAWASDWYGQHKIPTSYGTADDLLSKWKEGRSQGLSSPDAQNYATKILGWDNYTPPAPAPGPGGGGGGGGTGGGGSPTGTIGDLLKPFNETFNEPFYTFTPPTYAKPPAFTAPTAEEAAQTPGYQFSRDQALGAISNSAAAQGLWGTGATGKAMEDYATNLANTHYNDVYNRNLNTYMTNYATQYTDPYKFGYQAAYDAAASKQRATEMDYQKFMDDYNRYLTQNQFKWNVLNPFIFQ